MHLTLPELINLDGTPNRCIVAVSNLLLLAEMRRNLLALNIENRRSGRPEWDHTLVIDTNEALGVNKEGVLYIIAEFGNPNINLTMLFDHFQLPLFLISSDPIPSSGGKSSLDTLDNKIVYGYAQKPGVQQIFMAMRQMHWMTVAAAALLSRATPVAMPEQQQ